jgi:phage tail P2-like protein
MTHKSSLPAHYAEKEHRLSILASEIFDRHLRPEVDAMGRSKDPMRCEAKMPGVLAREYGTDYWSDAMDEASRRRLVAETIRIKRIIGTPKSLEIAFASIQKRTSIREWFDYDGEPFRFRLDVDVAGEILTRDIVSAIEAMAMRYKNVRSKLDGITASMPSVAAVMIPAVTTAGATMTVYPYVPDDIVAVAAPAYAGVVQSAITITNYPKESA